jgi:DUF4097 and DUF4098 domain-containing protein YvlB
MKTIVFLATISIFRMGGEIEVADAPNGASLHTMGGNIHVSRGAGRIIAKTMGGDIDIARLEGSADAGTMGGNIRVTVVGSGGGHDLDLHSMGGDIELVLPHDFSAEFSVELIDDNGDNDELHRIVSDFPLQVRESRSWRFFQERRVTTATGRSGAATNSVKIRTHGSNVTIRKR